MGSPAGPIPPAPVNDGGAGSEDQPTTGTYDPTQTVDAQWQYVKAHADEISQTLGAIHEGTGIVDRTIAKVAKVLAYVVPFIAQIEADLIAPWVSLEAEVYAGAIEPLSEAAAVEADAALGLLVDAMTGEPGAGVSFTDGPMGSVAQTAFNELIAPFTLVGYALDPTQPGSGFQAQDYLLAKAMSFALQEWIVEQLGQHIGMGFFKTLGPFLSVIDHSLNPSNIVRQAMESSYSFLLKTPLTRDLNRKYPMKDLGASALAHLYLRGAIDVNTYTDRCLSLGLSTEYAQQLILEAKKLLTRSDIAKLLAAGYITSTDATSLLTQQGYDSSEVPSILYLDTHARFFTLQETLANLVVEAWTKGKVTQATLETLLPTLGYTSDEIQLVEPPQFFNQTYGASKDLTYANVKDMYEADILGVDDVITYLQNQGYAANDVMNLVLLDFTVAEQRTLVRAQLIAQLNVNAQTDLVAATTDAGKNEAALAAAKTALASELTAEAKAYGQLETAPSILQLLGLD